MDKDKKITTGKYIEAVGRRKTSTARVRILESNKTNFIVNGKDVKAYFKTEGERRLVLDPMAGGLGAGKTGLKWDVEAKVSGGGPPSRAEAFRQGLPRSLVLSEGDLRKNLKVLGF